MRNCSISSLYVKSRKHKEIKINGKHTLVLEPRILYQQRLFGDIYTFLEINKKKKNKEI